MRKLIKNYFLTSLKIILFLSIGGGMSGCRRTLDSPLPPAPVYYRLYFNSPEGKNIQSVGSFAIIAQRRIVESSIGVGGLLVIHGFAGCNFYDANYPFVVFDLSCPIERSSEVTIQPVKGNVLAFECPKCHSIFSGLFNGYPGASSGPAAKKKVILRQYVASPIANGILLHN